MSTKNLARTIIEGGRWSGSKWLRNQQNRHNRRRFRNWLDSSIEFDDDPGEWLPRHAGDRKHREDIWGQNDKIHPIYRWVDSQVGRYWDDVYSDLCRRFDRRNLAQRHVIVDHVIGNVHGAGYRERPGLRYVSDEWFAKYDYDWLLFYRSFFHWYIDKDGRLQSNKYKRR
jgi:hypothetical protein